MNGSCRTAAATAASKASAARRGKEWRSARGRAAAAARWQKRVEHPVLDAAVGLQVLRYHVTQHGGKPGMAMMLSKLDEVSAWLAAADQPPPADPPTAP